MNGVLIGYPKAVNDYNQWKVEYGGLKFNISKYGTFGELLVGWGV